MEPQAPSRVKRREIILLIVGLAIVLWAYRSSGISLPASSAVASRVVALEPLDGGGSPAYVWLGWALIGLGNIFGSFPPEQVLHVLSILASSLASVALYFAYRALFSNIYVGVVPAALLIFSPLVFSASAAIERYAVGLFFILVAVWAWTAGRWLVWGAVVGLALSVHPASATVLLPFLATTSWPRRKSPGAWQPVAALLLMAALVLASYSWVVSRLGGVSPFWQDRASAALLHLSGGTISPGVLTAPLLALPLVLLSIVGVFALPASRRAGGKHLVFSLLITTFLSLALVAATFDPLAQFAGLSLVLLSTLSVPVLWLVEQRRDQLVFLLLWLLPALLALWLVRQSDLAPLLFAIPPLAITSGRLIDLSLDGQWLDFWWALGVPTKWYYRLLKLLVLAMLISLVVQATGVRPI